MVNQFWHNQITEKSFIFLQELRKNFKFVLIGGWAVYFHTHALKSKDIDIIVDFETLGELRKEFALVKNERLKKYEIRGDTFDVDIYVPHWSALGLPLDFVMKNTMSVEGFRVPRKEVLLILKLFVYTQRGSSLKGQKDLIDVLSLLYVGRISWLFFAGALKEKRLLNLLKELKSILQTTFEVKELNLNRKSFSDFKKPVLREIEKLS